MEKESIIITNKSARLVVLKFFLSLVISLVLLFALFASATSEEFLTPRLYRITKNELPEIGDPASLNLSEAEQKRTGLLTVLQINKARGIFGDELTNFYLQQLGSRVASSVNFSSESDADPFFFLVGSVAVNAFALPGSFIGINYGLIIRTKQEDELAAVIGHEIAHISKKHIIHRIEESRQNTNLSLIGIIAGVLAALSENTAASTGILLGTLGGARQSQLSFSRKQETEADIFGLRYLMAAGFDPRGMVRFHQILSSLSSGSQVPEYLKTHPSSINRISEISKRILDINTNLYQNNFSDKGWYHFIKSRLLVIGNLEKKKIDDFDKNMSDIELYTYGLLSFQSNKFKKSNMFFEELIKRNPEHELFLFSIAENYIDQSKYKKGIPYLISALNIYPDFLPARVLLARTYLKQKDYKRGCEVLLPLESKHKSTEAIKVGDAGWLKLSADCYHKKGDLFNYKLFLSDGELSSGNLVGAIHILKEGLKIQRLAPEQKKIYNSRIQRIIKLNPELQQLQPRAVVKN